MNNINHSFTKNISKKDNSVKLLMETIDLLVRRDGGLTKKTKDFLTPILEKEIENDKPNLKTIILRLIRNDDKDIRYLGYCLETKTY